MTLSRRVNAVFQAALAQRLVSNLTQFHARLRDAGGAFANSTLNKIFNGQEPAQKTSSDVDAALETFCKTNNIDFKPIVAAASDAGPPGRPAPAPEILSGTWLLVQFRGQRIKPNEPVADDDYRTALLRYSRGRGSTRRIEIIGRTSHWRGDAKEFDKKLLYQANEISRASVEESIWMLMIWPYERRKTPYNHGVILGIGRGEADHPEFPIYASRVILRQVPDTIIASNETDAIARSPITEQLCGHFPRKPIRGKQGPIPDFLNHSFELFEELSERDGNFGDRIFVQR